MKTILKAAQAREGRVALISMAAGIIGICVGGYLLKGSSVSDIVLIVCSILSVVGVEQFCGLIVKFRNENEEE